MRLYYCFFLVLLTVCSCVMPKSGPPSNLLEGIDKSSWYIYPSVLRLANVSQDQNFNKLIRPIERIDVHFLKGKQAPQTFQKLKSTLRRGDAHVLISARGEDDSFLQFSSTGLAPKERFVLLLHFDHQYALLELQGAPDLRYLQAISGADFDFFRKQLGGKAVVKLSDHKKKDPDE